MMKDKPMRPLYMKIRKEIQIKSFCLKNELKFPNLYLYRQK